MITNILSIIGELKAERAAGDEMAADLIERIDAHIRHMQAHVTDLETLKSWVKDSATARSMAITGMLGGEPETPPQTPAVIEIKEGEAA